MKGLLFKDLLYFKTQRVFLAVILGLVVLYLVSDMASFGITFLPLVMAMVVHRTVAADVMQGQAKRIFTLPFSRRSYVLEKYLMSVAMPGIMATILTLLAGLPGKVEWRGLWQTCLAAWLILAVLCMLTIPLTVMFKERATVMVSVVFVIVFMGVYFLTKLLPDQVSGLTELMQSWDIALLAAVAGGVCIVLLAVSYLLSVVLLEREEF